MRKANFQNKKKFQKKNFEKESKKTFFIYFNRLNTIADSEMRDVYQFAQIIYILPALQIPDAHRKWLTVNLYIWTILKYT